ncbi:MAG: tRNA uridine-5-carboxymethylaminomethyl(34) synthesis GTPase MnmE [Anaerohalosphaeraceae bacterium]
MYSLDDTIAAVSSPSLLPGRSGRTILRISGAGAFPIFTHSSLKFHFQSANGTMPNKRGITAFRVELACGVRADGKAYCFTAPASYTGQDLVELHLWAAQPVVDAIYQSVLQAGIRQAGPGEFTQRAYLNGKMDLSQAEAVMHIVSAGNEGQISAAQRLLQGGLAAKISRIQERTLELLSLLEAGLDFAEEEIEFIGHRQACDRIHLLSEDILRLLDGAVRCEELMELPSVGLVGAPNAGKSSLMNALTGTNRSIVSEIEGTTRDVLTALLELSSGACVLFDCAGLKAKQDDMLDELSQQSTIQAIGAASVILFCVDLTSDNLEVSKEIFSHLSRHPLIGIATKSDLIPFAELSSRVDVLIQTFGVDFLAVSSQRSAGMQALKTAMANALLSAQSGQGESDRGIAINLRHRQKLQSALKHLAEAAEEMDTGRTEIAAMLLRQAHQKLGGLEHEHVDERILDVIFSRFCIGK